MKPLFADAYYWFALLNAGDQGHSLAVEYSNSLAPMVTTEWVLTEVCDGMVARTIDPSC